MVLPPDADYSGIARNNAVREQPSVLSLLGEMLTQNDATANISNKNDNAKIINVHMTMTIIQVISMQ